MKLKLSDDEFVDHCIKHSTDPDVLRLAKILDRYTEAVQGLRHYVDVNDYLEVDQACQFVELIDYVEGVLSEQSHLREEVQDLAEKLRSSEREVKRLNARTLVEVAQEYQNGWNRERSKLQSDVKTAEFTAQRESARAERELARAKHLAHQLGMWETLKADFDN